MSSDPLSSFHLARPILILGSASSTRRLILQEMGIGFQIVKRPINEKEIGDRFQDSPSDLVLNLARAKMDHLVNEIQAGNCQDELHDLHMDEYIVLTADQVVTCNGRILEKPESVEQAKQFVALYPNHPPSTVGSCVLRHLPSGIEVSGVDTATIHFRSIISPESLVDDLIRDGQPVLDCAGGLMIEHALVKEHLDRIDGTEDSVMGLSKDLVIRLLKELSEKINSVV
jgi:septum formation protein